MNALLKSRLRNAALALAIAFLGLGTPLAEACSVPVFRWALERWPADPFELLVFHDAPLSEADEARLASIENRVADADTMANLHVRRVDVNNAANEDALDIWKAHDSPMLPCFLVMYPASKHVSSLVSSAGLDALNPDALLDSPARRELARRILDGQSGVWLLLTSGDVAKDAPAAALLQAQLDQASATLQLPDMEDDPTLEGPDAPDVSGLRVEFSMLEVRRDDPAEAALVDMLLGSEPDLRDFGEPMAFPVYGRGRVLYALVGAGITPKTIIKACAFLVGPCACEVKAENPGVDLLLSVDWDRGVGEESLIAEVQLPPLPGTAIPPMAAETDSAPGAQAARGLSRTIALTVAGAILLVAAGSFALIRRTGAR